MDLEQNERLEEWFLILGDWFRQTSKIWYYAAVAMLVLAIPLYMALNLFFEQILVNSVTPLRVIYEETVKQPIQVVEKKIFNLGNNTYSGYARLKNSNSDWGVPAQKYQVEFKTTGGSAVTALNGEAFILPSSDKIIVFPRFSSQSTPSDLVLTLSETMFIRPPNLPTLNLEIQRRSQELLVDQTLVNAVIVNRTPFKISRVDIPVLLYDSGNKVIGANYTNINDIDSSESRSFQYIWYNRINNVARIEIIPEINIYNRDIFITQTGQNPFDDRE